MARFNQDLDTAQSFPAYAAAARTQATAPQRTLCKKQRTAQPAPSHGHHLPSHCMCCMADDIVTNLRRDLKIVSVPHRVRSRLRQLLVRRGS
eukprot:COSAG06_NODE_957_length_11322_cov_9.239686_12_plen_92_part_00